jgi:hypothetical protein
MYTVALHDLKAVLKENTPAGQSKTLKSTATQEDGFKEIRRCKRHSTNETVPTSKKAVSTAVSATVDNPPKDATTQNFFTQLRACDMDTDSANTEPSPREATTPAKTGRLPPIVLTSAVNLIHLQKQLKGVSENFKFRSTRNRTRVITRSMANFQPVKSHFNIQNLSYYSFFPKSKKPVNSMISHLPHDTPAEDISDGLLSLVSTLLVSSR